MKVWLKDGEKEENESCPPKSFGSLCLGIVLILINLQNIQQFLSGSLVKVLN